MKYFFSNILVFLGALVVSVVVLPFGTLYALGHSVYFAFSSDIRVFLRLLVRFIDGTFFVLGFALFCLAKCMDYLWNVMAGEMFEDIVAVKENTWFGKKDITISEATGEREYNDGLTFFGEQRFVPFLNKIFGQRQHALDAYELGVKRRHLESKYYK